MSLGMNVLNNYVPDHRTPLRGLAKTSVIGSCSALTVCPKFWSWIRHWVRCFLDRTICMCI